jgi:DeoR family suf operon transcriptional repressor
MTHSWQFADSAPGRVLKAIQLRGKASIKDVAEDLGVTPSAVRLHLAQLEGSGAISASRVREGVGRPYHVYSLTPQGHDLFHRDYGELTTLLLEEVTRTQGTAALEGLLQRLSARLADLHRDQVRGKGLADRIEAWAELLDRRGVPVQIERTEDGYILREYGCQYHNVALENRAVCEMERQVMVHLLESGVQLTQCMLDGRHGCQFTITERETPGERWGASSAHPAKR